MYRTYRENKIQIIIGHIILYATNYMAGDVMQTFYYGIGFGNDLKIPAHDILISTSSCWKKIKGVYQLVVPEILSNPDSIWIDSGGFTCFTKWADYPWSIPEYVDFILRFCQRYPQVKYVSVMDLPCEPSIKRDRLETKETTNIQRIHQTIQNTRDCLRYKIPAKWVSVIQGYSKFEYAYCASLMHQFRLFTGVTAIGSICQRKKTKQLKDYLHFITKLANVKWHTFGMQISVLKDKTIADLLESSDSGAWKFKDYKNGTFKPTTYEQKLENYIRYSLNIHEQVLGDYRYRNLASGLT